MGRHSLPTLNLDTLATHAGRAQRPSALIWHTAPLSVTLDSAP